MVMPNLIFELAVQKKLPNGTVPIIARLIFRRKKVERTIIRVTSEQVALWDPLKKRFKPVATPYLNRIISDYQQKFDKFLSDHYDEIGKLELSDIVKIFDVDKTPEPDALLLLNYLDDYYQNVLLKQFEAGSGTPRNFTTAYNILKGFLVNEKLLKIKLTDFDKAVFVKFHDSMTDRNRLPKPMKPNSAGSFVKKLRPAFNRAVLLKLIPENPTHGTKITTKNKQKPRLDISELKRIYFLDCSDNYSLNLTKNVFLLCCFTGFSIKDVMGLTKAMLLKRDDGEVLIRKRREKSDEEVLIYLHKYSQDILQQFSELPEMSGTERLVPKRVGEFVNRQLKIIGAKASIPFSLSTNIGRHSHRQLIREAGIRDMATIKKMMGHAPPRDIDSVYDFVTSKDLLQAKNIYERFLKKHLSHD
jgi:integrase